MSVNLKDLNNHISDKELERLLKNKIIFDKEQQMVTKERQLIAEARRKYADNNERADEQNKTPISVADVLAEAMRFYNSQNPEDENNYQNNYQNYQNPQNSEETFRNQTPYKKLDTYRQQFQPMPIPPQERPVVMPREIRQREIVYHPENPSNPSNNWIWAIIAIVFTLAFCIFVYEVALGKFMDTTNQSVTTNPPAQNVVSNSYSNVTIPERTVIIHNNYTIINNIYQNGTNRT